MIVLMVSILGTFSATVLWKGVAYPHYRWVGNGGFETFFSQLHCGFGSCSSYSCLMCRKVQRTYPSFGHRPQGPKEHFNP